MIQEDEIPFIAKSLSQVLPHFTVSVLPYDPDTKEGAFLRRGENVRSAKNCLAIPSGLLEHGEDFGPGIFRELEEELGLILSEIEQQGMIFHSIYQNQPGDGYHWVIGVWLIAVRGLHQRISNQEPDKHDCAVTIPLELIRTWAQRDMCSSENPLFAGNLADPIIRAINLILK